LLASIIVTVALSAFQTNISTQSLFVYTLSITLVGPSSAPVNTYVYYDVNSSVLPSGFTPNGSPYYAWLIYYNTSTLVYDSSTGQTDSQYISDVSASQNELQFTPTKVGTYTISYIIEYNGTQSGYPAFVMGNGVATLQVNPNSPWNWIASAVEGAITYFVSSLAGSLNIISSWIGQVVFTYIIGYAVNVPTLGWPWGGLIKPIYDQILQISISLSLLFLAGTVAYNALRNNYTDITDIASDLLYKIGIWLLFTFGGWEIYDLVAIFVDDLIEYILYPHLWALGIEFSAGTVIWGVAIAVGAIPFFFGDIKTFVGDVLFALTLLTSLMLIRYFLILAIVALIPLLATLWLFEWTRKIAEALIDVLIALIIAGLLNAIILALFISTGTAFLFFLLPFVVDLGTLASLVGTLFVLKPHESIGFSQRKWSSSNSGGSEGTSQQSPSQPNQPSGNNQGQKSYI